MGNLWNFVGSVFVTFATVAYLIVLFQVVVDLFRDDDLSVGAKVLWLVALVFMPFVTALVYVIARGPSMADRHRAAQADARAQSESWIRSVAVGGGPADQIASGRKLLEAGTISHEEFTQLKAKALAPSAA